MRKVFETSLAIIAMGVIFASGYTLGKYFQEQTGMAKIERMEQVDLSLFWDAWDILHQRFLEKDKLNAQELVYGAIKGMFRAAGDPYTTFFTPEEAERFEEEMKGEYGGVGMIIGIKDNQIIVISPFPGTPAQKAGILAGDKILKIDGQDTSFMSTDEAASLIRGAKGTKVTLTIFRDAWNKTKDIELIRDVVKIPNLNISDISEEIVRIEIYQFNSFLAGEFEEAVQEILQNSRKQKIILDLRNNGGGYLDVVKEIAGYFLKTGEVILIEDYGEHKEQKIHKSQGRGELLNYPLVILINKGTASGAEILAGVLRDNREILLIGEKSFGKGSVQEPITLKKDGSLFKITTAKWLTPSGHSISEKGLEPDIKIEMTEKDYLEEKDPQLDRAIEIIKEMR